MQHYSLRIILLGLTLPWAAVTAAEPAVDAVDDGWRLSVPVYLSAVAFYQDTRSDRNSFQAVSTSAELLFSARHSPWTAGVFIDKRFSAEREYDGIVNAGGSFEYEIRDWDASMFVFNHNPPRASSQWVYATRVRYRFATRHKVGLEALGTFDNPSAPIVSIGYYGSVSRQLTIKFVAGIYAKSGRDRVARTELVWQLN